LKIVQLAALDYPISHKEHGPEHLMDHRHLWLRTPRQVAILRTRAKIVRAIREFFDSKDFVLMDAPMLTPNSCEGASELFETDYFDGKAYLTQSGQLYGEAGAMALKNIYTFGPTFRAEKSKTRKHLTEFWMIEPEMAFCDLEGVMTLAESFVKSIFAYCLENCKTEFAILKRDTTALEKVVKNPFHRIPYEKCIELLNKNGFDLKFGDDFGAPEETKLGELFDGMPVFIQGFPKEMKSFYFKVDPANPKMVLGCDLIAPDGYGEVIGGSERESDFETLRQNLIRAKLSEDDYKWYLDLRKYGSVPHGGFGLGLERTVAWICGLDHVRETIPFPRLINYIRP
jgi:asparaginyl-tRNA synthetase